MKKENKIYFKQKNWDNIGRWLEADESEVRIKRIRRILHCAIIGVGYLIIFIVNNGNILTDGRRYRKRPKIEM